MTASPSACGEPFLGRLAAAAALDSGFSATLTVAAPLTAAPCFEVPFGLARFRAGGEPSDPSGAARRVVFRAGRAAGVDCAGSTARVRGATIVAEV